VSSMEIGLNHVRLVSRHRELNIMKGAVADLVLDEVDLSSDK
jgi:hypothetical protein